MAHSLALHFILSVATAELYCAPFFGFFKRDAVGLREQGSTVAVAVFVGVAVSVAVMLGVSDGVLVAVGVGVVVVGVRRRRAKRLVKARREN